MKYSIKELEEIARNVRRGIIDAVAPLCKAVKHRKGKMCFAETRTTAEEKAVAARCKVFRVVLEHSKAAAHIITG